MKSPGHCRLGRACGVLRFLRWSAEDSRNSLKGEIINQLFVPKTGLHSLNPVLVWSSTFPEVFPDLNGSWNERIPFWGHQGNSEFNIRDKSTVRLKTKEQIILPLNLCLKVSI